MNIKPIASYLSVSEQIQPADVAAIAARGFRAIINNRPNGETDDQPPSADIAAQARRHNIAYREIPVIAGKLREADVKAFTDAMDELRGPVLAYCRSGTRSVTLWALYAARRLDVDAILEVAAGAGYDLGTLAPRLREIAAENPGAAGKA